MTITHHLDDATLMSYAAGSLPHALAAVAATHIAMCPRCRVELAHHERIGAAMVEALAPVAMRHAEPVAPVRVNAPPEMRDTSARGEVLGPLARVIGQSLDGISWKPIGVGVWHHRLPTSRGGILQVLKVSGGRSVPEHGHSGAELTLVLRGVLHDATGRYRAGDVADLDDTVEHQPVAEGDEDCICVVASEAPARFRGLVARLLQPWHGL